MAGDRSPEDAIEKRAREIPESDSQFLFTNRSLLVVP